MLLLMKKNDNLADSFVVSASNVKQRKLASRWFGSMYKSKTYALTWLIHPRKLVRHFIKVLLDKWIWRIIIAHGYIHV